MIQTQSQNDEIRQIEKIAWRKDRDKVSVEVWRKVRDKVWDKVWWKVWSEVMHEGRIKKVREKFD